ncbi:efflux transporter periplasmic adaptor subunit [Pseudomonas fluorescens]|uniref:Efflux transporter periplasmic adaptor subunit n=1 Tax=Pseudomonas fluorescens TaxID=294 RepID=A0A1T2ZA01_PSEFL|nr:efflux RND transporter periplasmic adaptor subunit [Pseudomonas fluorescens]OPB00928.1 efflux transporter periplasmic adaptor subunit [Pseudomonas fluorescens]
MLQSKSTTLLSISLTLASLLIVAGTAGWLLSREPVPVASAVTPSVPVSAIEVQYRDVPVLIHAIGNVRSLHSVEIRSQVDGLLLELPVKEGQLVKRGDLLARVDDRAIVATLEQAKAQKAVAQAQLASASLDLKRYQALATTQAISTQTLDQQQALVTQLRATVQSQQATVAASQVQLSYTRILSPTDGRVGIRNFHEGSYVRSSDILPLFTVVQLDPISIEAAFPQALLPKLRALVAGSGQSPVILRAYSGDGGALLSEGRLNLIDNRISNDTGTVRIKGDFANAQGQLWPDQSVVVSVQAATLNEALVVPQRALRQGAQNTFVWRIRDGKASPQSVQVTYADADIAVVKGIEIGDQIVDDGYSRLSPGAQVRILNAKDFARSSVANGDLL